MGRGETERQEERGPGRGWSYDSCPRAEDDGHRESPGFVKQDSGKLTNNPSISHRGNVYLCICDWIGDEHIASLRLNKIMTDKRP